MIGWSDNPALDAERYYEELEAHQNKFPVCESCGISLMNEDRVIKIGHDYYCDDCARVMTNDEMREEEDL